jgi:hypothetical protein
MKLVLATTFLHRCSSKLWNVPSTRNKCLTTLFPQFQIQEIFNLICFLSMLNILWCFNDNSTKWHGEREIINDREMAIVLSYDSCYHLLISSTFHSSIPRLCFSSCCPNSSPIVWLCVCHFVVLYLDRVFVKKISSYCFLYVYFVTINKAYTCILFTMQVAENYKMRQIKSNNQRQKICVWWATRAQYNTMHVFSWFSVMQ